MDEEYEGEAPVLPSKPRGFHKRKKKRRKEAQKKQEQPEGRKKRKLEKEFALYGGAIPGTGSELDVVDENNNVDDEEREPTASLSGTTKYDGENMTVTVIMSEISREEEDFTGERTQTAMP